MTAPPTTARRVMLGCVLAPLIVTLLHAVQLYLFPGVWLAASWPPLIALVVAPYGLCAIAALPYFTARLLTGKWPGESYLMVSWGLTGGACAVLVGRLLGFPTEFAFFLYAGFCVFASGIFYAAAFTYLPPSLKGAAILEILKYLGGTTATRWSAQWAAYLKTPDYKPDFRLGAEHPTRKGWYATKLKDAKGRPLWYKPPGPISRWVRRIPFMLCNQWIFGLAILIGALIVGLLDRLPS